MSAEIISGKEIAQAKAAAEKHLGAKGISGNTPADLREVASVWDKSAEYCDEVSKDLGGDHDMTEQAARDRRFAAAMREAASILEALRY